MLDYVVDLGVDLSKYNNIPVHFAKLDLFYAT